MATTATTRNGLQLQRPAPAPGQRMRHLRQMNWLGGLAGWIWLAIVIIPIYWVVITSLKAQSGYYASNPLVPPADPTLANYQFVIESNFINYFVNSVVVTVGAVVPAVLVSFMA